MVGEGMTEKVEAQVYYSNSAYIITARDVDMAGVGEFTIRIRRLRRWMHTEKRDGRVEGRDDADVQAVRQRRDGEHPCDGGVEADGDPPE